VKRHVRDAGVAGSNPATPTILLGAFCPFSRGLSRSARPRRPLDAVALTASLSRRAHMHRGNLPAFGDQCRPLGTAVAGYRNLRSFYRTGFTCCIS
jgi:hypothetical protein